MIRCRTSVIQLLEWETYYLWEVIGINEYFSFCMSQAVLWNMHTLQTESTKEEHQYLITDVRFRPNSTQLATADRKSVV